MVSEGEEEGKKKRFDFRFGKRVTIHKTRLGSSQNRRSQSVSSNEEISRRGSGYLERVVEEDEDGVGLHELESF